MRTWPGPGSGAGPPHRPGWPGDRMGEGGSHRLDPMMEDLRDKVALVPAAGAPPPAARWPRPGPSRLADLDEDGAGARRARRALRRGRRPDLMPTRPWSSAPELAGHRRRLPRAGVATGCGVGEDFDPSRTAARWAPTSTGSCQSTPCSGPAQRGGGAIVATASLVIDRRARPALRRQQHASRRPRAVAGPALAGGGSASTPCARVSLSHAGADPRRPDQGGLHIIPPDVADVVVGLWPGDMAGECWFVQPGRTAPSGSGACPARAWSRRHDRLRRAEQARGHGGPA